MNFDASNIDFSASNIAKNNSKIISASLNNLSTLNYDRPIIVQVVLDGKIVSETVTRYQRRTERAFA